jgi:hypothetical protein
MARTGRVNSRGVIKPDKKTKEKDALRFAYQQPESAPIDSDDEESRPFVCVECNNRYASSASLYQHKRSKHPWLITIRSEVLERTYECPACDKCYGSSQGLYQQ